MSRQSVLNEVASKMMELEAIAKADAFGKTDFGMERSKILFQELSELRYTNAMCGEKSMQEWMAKLRNKFAEHFASN